MLSRDDVALYREQGFVVVRGALDPPADLAPLREGYARLLDRLAADLLDAAPAPRDPAKPASVAETFATLFGATRGQIYEILDPLLSMHDPGFRRLRGIASPYIPELFELIRHPRILDVVESVVGPEITASPVFHVNLKLGRRHLEQARRSAGQPPEQPADASDPLDYRVSRTPLHNDAHFGLRDHWRSGTVTVWIPLTDAPSDRGALTLVPRSHHWEEARAVSAPGTEVVIETVPGDLIVLDNRLDHGSTENRSDEHLRWSFNFRYAATGAPTGRPYLPSFVARSRIDPSRELRDPALWAAMWKHALDCVRWYDFPRLPSDLGMADAEAVTARWNARIRDHRSWLDLREPGFAHRVRHELPARASRLRVWLGARRREWLSPR